MAKIYYVECSKCKGEYYIDNILLEKATDDVKLKCPYCQVTFAKKKTEILGGKS
jgi:DNA-directed RNA polymerase subunit RPC12/RpoP